MKNIINYTQKNKTKNKNNKLYAARDYNGDLNLYLLPPERGKFHRVWLIDNVNLRILIPNGFLPNLKWEDEPIIIKEIK